MPSQYVNLDYGESDSECCDWEKSRGERQLPCQFLDPKDLHDFTEYSDGLEMQEQDNLTDGDDGHLVDVDSGMM